MARATTAEDYKLLTGFEAARRVLVEQADSERLAKPLAYWALPNDRRLPLAFLGRTLNELINTPFEELASTPGVGQKKLHSLVTLLHRAAHDETFASPADPEKWVEAPPASNGRANGQFDPTVVSEAVWVQWRETVRAHRLEQEKLGRLAPSLQAVPTVIWHTPLGFYTDYTLTEIRQLKTHGEKRVRVVLEVFHVVHEMLQGAQSYSRLAIRLVPAFVLPLENYIQDALTSLQLPDRDELIEQLVRPLLAQIETDAGPIVRQLAEARLGVLGTPQSVRMQSRTMGVTRARIYQLLEECSKVMDVRWPEGRHHLGLLLEKMQNEGAREEQLAVLHLLRDLMYPQKYQPVDEAVLS